MHYAELIDAETKPLSSFSLRGVFWLLGVASVLAASTSGHTGVFGSSQKKAKRKGRPFVPLEGVSSVLVPAGGGGALSLGVLPGKGPLCIFDYRKADEDVTNYGSMPMQGAWVYGAQSVGTQLAYATADPGHVLKGRLFCWASSSAKVFFNHLKEEDIKFNYNPKANEAGIVRRGIITVVKKDGTSKNAYWYFQASVMCPICLRRFHTTESMQQHSAMAHKPKEEVPEQAFPCQFCDRVFHSSAYSSIETAQEARQLHIRDAHPEGR
eukprot:gb/GEZN01010534.1/.p1 GENE.gb/GEZN01010534.1/~~gb/GEZN01010534.1/.p1  ORF type:complete len:267 (+),score=34.51 gb/GEZN01010534.1/:34-834(+)